MRDRRLAAAQSIWRSRRGRSPGERAFLLYALGLVLLIVGAPVLRALWSTMTGPAGTVLLLSAQAADATSLAVAALWAGGLLAGRTRGPALLPTFLLHALTGSDIRRSRALLRPVLQAALAAASLCAGAAVLAAVAVVRLGQAGPVAVVVFGLAGAAAGAVAVVLWLVGQAHPRAAVPIAASLVVLAVLGAAISPAQVALPWMWVGALYPGAAWGAGVLPLVGVLAITAAGAGAVPHLLSRLPGTRLLEQAVRWERAVAFSSALDLRSARAAIAVPPRWGRGLRAVRPGRRLWVMFLVRDAIAQVRTPGRLLGAVAATALTGVLLTASLSPGVPTVLTAGVAGLVVHGASGSLSAGLQHAADVASDNPLYGVGDRHLVTLHALFPLAVLLLVLVPAAFGAALMRGAPPGIAMASAGALAVLAVALQAAGALKGPLPPGLLTPVDTPAGDVSVVLPIVWACGEPVLAVLGAVSLAAVPVTPLPFLLVAAWTGALLLVRWGRRR